MIELASSNFTCQKKKLIPSNFYQTIFLDPNLIKNPLTILQGTDAKLP